VGEDLNGIYSKISLFQVRQLGGDDIDRLIAIEYLSTTSQKWKRDFRTRKKKELLVSSSKQRTN
jgi:hypothetical protein